MFYNDRISAVQRLLSEFTRSPSLRHVRDPNMLSRLAEQIVRTLEERSPIWRKWRDARETVIKAACEVWLPVDDLRDFLNELPGPHLTTTDIEQRLRALYEDSYASPPDERLRDACLTIYEREKTEGTELPAIIGLLQQFIDRETIRLRKDDEASARRQRDDERLALEPRFLSGADCKWTTINGSKDFFTRKNGRAYRLSPTKDKRWDLFRIKDQQGVGELVGRYGTRGDATKVMNKLAYEPEPRW